MQCFRECMIDHLEIESTVIHRESAEAISQVEKEREKGEFA